MNKEAIIFFAMIIMVGSSAIAQPPNNMTAGTYTLTGTLATWYDPGGAGGGACPSVSAGNYANSLNIIETMSANPGQKIILTWSAGTFGLASGDFLTVYDGPNTTFPILASYNSGTPATPIPATIYTTGNSITFLFISDATNTCKGWQAAVSAYYFMQPGSFTFSCPGPTGGYTFVDNQLSNSSGIGGDASCTTGGSQANYQDVSLVETFFTGNGQCIQIDHFPNSIGICSNDVLTVYDGPSILSPIANGGSATWTNTFTNPSSFSTLGNSATVEFLQDGNIHARGWRMTMSCVNCPAASINNDCVNAIIVTPGASCNSMASSVGVSNSLQAGMPACVGTPNDDVWYRFTANNATTQITVAATDGTMDPVIQLLSGTCGSFTSLYCQNATGAGGTETINATGLTPGTTYYVRVYDFAAANANHNFNICVVGAATTDCVAAQQVCTLTTFTHTNDNYPDFGTQEYNSSYWGCEVSGEARSAWYYFQIATPGKLGFNIYSVGGVYQNTDFTLWGPLTGLNCPMNTSPLRCSWANAHATNSYGLPAYSTGLETGAGDNTEGSGGDGFVESINVTAGEWYVLMVNIYAGPNSYNISWMDNIPANQQATLSSCGGCTPPTANDAAISANGPTTFCFGGNVILTVANSNLMYQWRYGGSTISGATNQSFTATATGSYQCDVSNSCGDTTSNSISVTVNNAPSASQAAISANGNTTICNGGSVILTVATSGLTYQWKKGGTIISGATNQSFTATTSGNYKCDVSNNCGTTTSNNITVTVNNGPTTAQAMISANSDTTFCSGGSVVLMVATAGLTYQWKNNGSTISGATSQSFTATTSGSYQCDVSNSCGTTTSNSITVTVNGGPSSAEAAITAGGPTTFCKGNTVVELTVATSGLTYQWKKGNSIIVGATLQSYSAAKTANYKCEVSNNCGTTTSNIISVTVNPSPTASISQAPCSGGAVLLTCTFTPSSGVTFKWKKGNTIISGATNSTFSATQSATYKCIVTITATGCSKASAGSNVTITCKSGNGVNDNKMIVYPNPTSDYFNINTSQLDPQSMIYIYDLTGRLLESHKVSGGEMKVGEALSNGVYFLKIAANNEELQMIKLIKSF